MRTLLSLGLLLLIISTQAQNSKLWSLEGYYDVKNKYITTVTSYKMHTLHDVLGAKGFNLDIKAFAGRSNKDRLVTGFALTYCRPVARELDLMVGLAARVDSGRAVSGGLYAGISWKF